MRIACIEDEKSQRDYIVTLCEKWARENETEVLVSGYGSSEEFLFKHESFPFDLMLADISMGEINGIELAKTVRNRDEAISIAFITGDRDYALDGYEVGAVRYLLKPVDYDKLSVVLSLVAKKASNLKPEKESTIIVEFDSMKKAIYLRDILYIEASGHYCEVHMVKGEVYSLKEGFSSLQKRAGCISCHRSYAVNLDYVESIKRSGCILKGGTELPISRGCFASINQEFLDRFKPEELWE